MSIDSIDVETGLPKRAAAEAQAFKIQRRHARQLKVFDPVMVRQATWRSFVMLDPTEHDAQSGHVPGRGRHLADGHRHRSVDHERARRPA